MLKIKLARFGKRNQPHYRIVVNEARDKRDGSYVALVGHYAPTQTPKVLDINVAAYEEWLAKGAQPTDTVAHLFKRHQSGNPFPEKPKKLSKKAKAKQASEQEAETAAPEAAAETSKTTESAEETQTQETPVEENAAEETPTEAAQEATEAEKSE